MVVLGEEYSTITSGAPTVTATLPSRSGAALPAAAQDLRRVPLSPAAVAIGSEGRGLSAQLLAQCDGQIIIPMQPGAESLNAAVAAAVVMWEIARAGM